jgi:large subunit ribosomal protein L5
MKTLQEKQAKVFETIGSDLGITNIMQAPKIEKIVINVGTGSKQKKDRFANDFIAAELAKITGQKPSARSAKQSIAGFKIRQGDQVGQAVTLRGEHMRSFFDKLVNIALPRTKDFRGIDTKVVDSMGNLTLGIKEHTIFPETGDQDLSKIFGLAITIVTTSANKKDAIAYFKYLGMPFKKQA